MKDSAYWLRVAKLVHDAAVRGEKYMGLCNGIARAVEDLGPHIAMDVDDLGPCWRMWRTLDDMYKPSRAREYWWGKPGSSEQGDNARVLAALFLREMALDDEGRK